MIVATHRPEELCVSSDMKVRGQRIFAKLYRRRYFSSVSNKYCFDVCVAAM